MDGRGDVPGAGNGEVILRYLGYARLSYTGPVTKRRYLFAGHGAELLVNTSDVAALLLMRRRTGQCCGGRKEDAGPLFEEIGDNTDVNHEVTEEITNGS